MTISTFQYPPDLFTLLVDTLPTLCRGKRDLLLFFRGAGTPSAMLADFEAVVARDRQSVNEYEIARTVLSRLNEAGDSALAARRELLKRICGFEDFTRCYENDTMKAKGLVAEVRRLVGVHDSFTRMAREREQESAARRAAQQRQADAARATRERIDKAKTDLFALFGMNDAQRRGKALEKVLNDLFNAYGILVAEDFSRKGNGGLLEQIDGVVELDGQLYLVEMKWWEAPLGPAEISPHLSRLMVRHGVGGVFISASSYTTAAIEMCRDFLQQRVLILCSLQEIVQLFNSEGNLLTFLQAKVRAAKLDRTPFKEVGV